MPTLTRRQFLKGVGALAAAPVIGPGINAFLPFISNLGNRVDVYLAQNGTPDGNVKQALALAGGIQRFIDPDDVVVLKPNGQWPNQGYTHTLCLKGLIDAILARPGGFSGEVIIAEHVHRDPSEAMSGSYCWNMSKENRVNNWPDMNYFELVADYHRRGILNVTAAPLYDSWWPNWSAVAGPGDLKAGEQGWVGTTYTTKANGRTVWLSRPIIRSSYSGKLVDVKNGVWQGGGYSRQKTKLIFLPTLNNHGNLGYEDYAGPTSALKCHIGFVDFNLPSGSVTLHSVGYDYGSPTAMGEAVGELITSVITPTFYLTCAEYTGYVNRTSATAAHTRSVGLCTDPVTLDYWMCKHLMYPCETSQTFMNPDNNSNLRSTLLGCNSRGVGTIDEAQINVVRSA